MQKYNQESKSSALKIVHPDLASGRWQTLSLAEQRDFAELDRYFLPFAVAARSASK